MAPWYGGRRLSEEILAYACRAVAVEVGLLRRRAGDSLRFRKEEEEEAPYSWRGFAVR